mgnify:CR=1 FL=1
MIFPGSFWLQAQMNTLTSPSFNKSRYWDRNRWSKYWYKLNPLAKRPSRRSKSRKKKRKRDYREGGYRDFPLKWLPAKMIELKMISQKWLRRPYVTRPEHTPHTLPQAHDSHALRCKEYTIRKRTSINTRETWVGLPHKTSMHTSDLWNI